MIYIPLIIFIFGLIVCIVFNINVVFAMICGYIVFNVYALLRKIKLKVLYKLSLDGIKKCKNVLITFSIIAILTGCWRFSGTIEGMVYYLLHFVSYKYFVLMTFILCSIMSLLTGSLLGAAATMGVICMTIGNGLGISPIYTGGAVLSGVIVGDRMSPLSSSCLLVAEITKTDMYNNIKNMFKTSIVPYIVTCIMYLVMGMASHYERGGSIEVINLLYDNYNINFISIIPIIFIVVLSLLKINIKINVTVNIVISIIVGIINEKVGLSTILTSMITGYKAINPDVGKLLDGGGLFSVLSPVLIVAFASMIVELMKYMDMLSILDKKIDMIYTRTNGYITSMIVGFIMSIIGCNQTVPVILTETLLESKIKDNVKRALYIENSSIIIPMLIPWNIACKASLQFISCGTGAIFFAFFIYIMIIYNIIVSRRTI